MSGLTNKYSCERLLCEREREKKNVCVCVSPSKLPGADAHRGGPTHHHVHHEFQVSRPYSLAFLSNDRGVFAPFPCPHPRNTGGRSQSRALSSRWSTICHQAAGFPIFRPISRQRQWYPPPPLLLPASKRSSLPAPCVRVYPRPSASMLSGKTRRWLSSNIEVKHQSITTRRYFDKKL